jgi:chromosome segregation ATPase
VRGWEEAHEGAKLEPVTGALLRHHTEKIDLPWRKVTAKELADVLRQHKESLKKEGEVRQAIEEHNQELQSLPETDIEKLREALLVAEGAAEADKTLEASRMTLKSLGRKAEDARALIPDVPEDLDVATRLSVPTPNKIRIFRERFANLKTDHQTAAKRVRDEKEAVSKLQGELDRLGRRGELPTEDSLDQAREHRDHGWQLVLADWKGAGAAEKFDPVLPLEEAFPRAVSRADEIADQLRRDADAVAQAEAQIIIHPDVRSADTRVLKTNFDEPTDPLKSIVVIRNPASTTPRATLRRNAPKRPHLLRRLWSALR